MVAVDDLGQGIGDILGVVTAPLRAADVRYMLVGSVAVMVHGEPRFTRDIDVSLDLQGRSSEDIRALLARTGLPIEGPRRGDFGERFVVIHPSMPVEVFMAPDHPALVEEFDRASPYRIGELDHLVIAPADLILRKLVNQRIRTAQKDIEDLRSLLRAQRNHLDLDALRQRAQFYRVIDRLDQVLESLD